MNRLQACQPLAISPPYTVCLAPSRIGVKKLRIKLLAKLDDLRFGDGNRPELMDGAGRIVFQVALLRRGAEMACFAFA